MRKLYCIILLLFFQHCFAQDSTSKIFIREVNWKIAIPENFELVEDSVQNKLNKKGVKLMEEANDLKISINDTRTLFSAHNGNNFLYSTITPFAEKKDGSYAAANAKMTELLYRTFKEKSPKAQLDSNITTVTIDNLLFEKFTLGISINNRHLMSMCVLYKLYKGFDFGITYIYMNDWAHKAIEKVIFESKFIR